jgi:hypothetical protein
MPSWNELLQEIEAQTDDGQRNRLLVDRQLSALNEIGRLRSDRNVLLYASAYLQKPDAPNMWTMIAPEDINGFMATIYGMDWRRGLTLVLHTPGGVTNAAETIVAYLWSKFPDLEVIVPAYAMSAGTMISLAANRIVMGRQSQLGPIDPQMGVDGRFVSARSIVDQFEMARRAIVADREASLVWAPVLREIGPALLQEALNALHYSERMVGQWLARHMLAGQPNAEATGKRIAAFFNDAAHHKSHGHRIDRDEARAQGVIVEDLEDNQALQEAVLTAYHMATIAFEKSPAAKILAAHTGRMWIKNAG